MKHQLIWLGIRQSDITDTNRIFDGSITIFGSGSNRNYSMEQSLNLRINHNGACTGYESFMLETMRHILTISPQTRFLQYDPLDGVSFPSDLQDKFCYQNDYALISFLNHKIKLKQWIDTYTPILPYQLVSGLDCNFAHLKELFPNQEAVVIQQDISCGGEGTFLYRFESEQLPDLPIKENELYMVTAFQSNSISVNVHAVLYPEQTVLFPPSIQIIDHEHFRLEYLGADFSTYCTICAEEQQLIIKTAFTVCNSLRKLGYRGVCGIDLLLADKTCYFMEINPRFQASTALLNRYLFSTGLPSVQEYHIDSFLHDFSKLPKPPAYADGSFFIYHFHREQESHLRWIWKTLQNTKYISLCDDCLSWHNKLEDGCYLFQLRHEKAISSLTFQHTLRLHPNVKLSPFKLNTDRNFSNLLRLKLLLLSRGISITEAAWDMIQKSGGADFEEFNAITLCLFNKIWITAPCMEPWHTLSPMELDILPDKNKLGLYYYGKALFPVEIMPEDPYRNLQTKNGHFIKDIVYLNPDRLRVYHRSGCALQNTGIGCKFCDLYSEENAFCFDDIREALSHYWNNPRIKHFLIGGGSELHSQQYASILQTAEYLHTHSDKHIYLMSQPICDLKTLQHLQAFGVTEVSFNIEMFDRNLAQKVMPGKSRNTLEYYFESLKNAVSLWGDTGNVRSALILGFDDLDVFAQGIHKLCQIGVTPILSLYRPCMETPLANFMPIDEHTALLYYETANRICKNFGKKLGPSCKACQNNTVTLDM